MESCLVRTSATILLAHNVSALALALADRHGNWHSKRPRPRISWMLKIQQSFQRLVRKQQYWGKVSEMSEKGRVALNERRAGFQAV